jgi:hypothetical protein
MLFDFTLKKMSNLSMDLGFSVVGMAAISQAKEDNYLLYSRNE